MSIKRGYSQSLRPFNRHFANKNSIINTNDNTAWVKDTTARDRAVGSSTASGWIKLMRKFVSYKGNGPDWLFDIDSLTISMNYVPVATGNKTNGIAGTKDNTAAGQAKKEKEPAQEYILILICITNPSISQGPKDRERDTGMKPTEVDENEASDISEKDDEVTRSESERLNQREMQTENTNSTNGINTVIHLLVLLTTVDTKQKDVEVEHRGKGTNLELVCSRVILQEERFQVTPKISHLYVVKRIFRYLKGQPKLGLWNPRDPPFHLEAFSDSDYARASLDRKSTTGVTPLLDSILVEASEEVGEDSIPRTDSTQIPIINQPSTFSQPKKKQKSSRKQRKEAEVLDLEKAKSDQAIKIASLKKRVDKLKKRRQRMHPNIGGVLRILMSYAESPSYEKLKNIQNEDQMFDISNWMHESYSEDRLKLTLAQTLIEIKAAKPKVVITTATTTTTTSPKARGVVVQEPSEFRTSSVAQPSMSKDKGKAIMIKPEVEDKESDEVEEIEEDDEDVLKKYLVIKKDDDIAIDVIPFATRLPVIVDYKLHKEGLMAHYELIRADGTSKRYTSMIRLLQEIDKLADEYELGIEKKGHILDHIWEYCNQVHNKNYEWHNYEFENEECEDIGIKDKEYHPLEVQVETFEVNKYSFNGGQSFICVTKDLDNALPLERKNISKFKEMIRNEVEQQNGNGG
ncbi:hypothetical protein Tco_0134204 [Tanacetum coccineum]